MHPLDQSWLSIKRAKHHLNVLDRNLRAFYKAESLTITEEVTPEYVWYIRRIEMVNPPPKLGVVAGDAVTNLRFSLDHLTWQLALTKTPTPYDRTEFPIIKDWTARNEGRFKTVLKDVPPAAIDIIKSLQPYLRGKAAPEHPLWLLDQLANITKHVVIPTHGAFIEIKLPADPRIKVWMPHYSTTLIFIPIDLKPQVDLAPKPSASVTFGYQERGIVVNPRQLADIYQFIADDVLPRFTRFFPKRQRAKRSRPPPTP